MGRQLFRYDPHLGYTFIPGLKARVEHEAGGYLLTVNSFGFRSEVEFEELKGNGRFRILLFGDSFTAGDGVSNPMRYGDVLEALIPGLEVYNFGLPGSGTDQQYLAYSSVASRFEHDLVLISVSVENIRRVTARYRVYFAEDGRPVVYSKPYFTLRDDGSLSLGHSPVPREPVDVSKLSRAERSRIDRGGRFNLLYLLLSRIGGGVTDWAQRASHYQPLPGYRTAQSRDWVLLKAILRAWIVEAAQPVLICPIPVHQYIEETADAGPCRARFRELGRETGVAVHDPLPDLWRLPGSDRRALRFERDVHPSPAGHQRLAESLAPRIRACMRQRRV